MNTQEARSIVLGSFDANGGSYRHVYPYRYTNFIDGMAWIGVLCGACYKAKDTELAAKCVTFLNNLINVGKDARNYAPAQVKPEWKASTSMPGFWYKEDPQASAGPLGLGFAVKCGAPISIPPYLDVKRKSAERLTSLGFLYGFTCKWISSLRQHMNSMWMSYLEQGKRPSSTMLWMCEDNPFYSYVAGKKCSAAYPDMHKTSEGTTKEGKKIVPLKSREPDPWVFKDWPYTEYVRTGQVAEESYVPVAQVAGDYLQGTL